MASKQKYPFEGMLALDSEMGARAGLPMSGIADFSPVRSGIVAALK